jgi:hypothetical protein
MVMRSFIATIWSFCEDYEWCRWIVQANGRATILIILTALLVGGLVLWFSWSVLPAAPRFPTPTFPQGITLPEKLPRIPR